MEIATPDARWNDFVQSSPDGWWWHRSEWLGYSLAYTGGDSWSFMVTENKQVLAICPLIRKNNELDMFWSPLFSNDLNPRKLERVIDFLFKYVDQIMREQKFRRVSMMIYPLSFPSYNYLMKQGYHDISLNTQVIDLHQPLSDIHSAMRKGHDYDIDRGLKELQVRIFDKHGLETQYLPPFDTLRWIFGHYCNLHERDAGRITRPQITFDMQREWIIQGNAILLSAEYGDRFNGFSYIFLYKDKAYYGSACSDPDYHGLPIGHVLTWKTIEWLKEHGYRYYELGIQYYGPQLYSHPTDKEISISKFKRGFGGFTVPLFRGEKYASKSYFLEVNQERIKRYSQELEEQNAVRTRHEQDIPSD